jgi:hypothetical protein
MIGERTYFNVDRAKLNEILEQTGQP